MLHTQKISCTREKYVAHAKNMLHTQKICCTCKKYVAHAKRGVDSTLWKALLTSRVALGTWSDSPTHSFSLGTWLTWSRESNFENPLFFHLRCNCIPRLHPQVVCHIFMANTKARKYFCFSDSELDCFVGLPFLLRPHLWRGSARSSGTPLGPTTLHKYWSAHLPLLRLKNRV